jgi:hypothetical protein
MTNLIIPSTELFVPSRRSFITGVLVSAIAAPMIAKAENLMEINTLQNRLTWALTEKYGHEMGYKDHWIESGINASQAWNHEFLTRWQDYNSDCHYELKRKAEIVGLRTEAHKRSVFNHFVRGRGYDQSLLIPEPKKADFII